MPRRLSLALAALLLLLVPALLTMRQRTVVRAPRPLATNATAADSARRDSLARADTLPGEDPPCLASRIGLPCR